MEGWWEGFFLCVKLDSLFWRFVFGLIWEWEVIVDDLLLSVLFLKVAATYMFYSWNDAVEHRRPFGADPSVWNSTRGNSY